MAVCDKQENTLILMKNNSLQDLSVRPLTFNLSL